MSLSKNLINNVTSISGCNKDKDKEVNAASVINVSEQDRKKWKLSMKTKRNKAVQLSKRVHQERPL